MNNKLKHALYAFCLAIIVLLILDIVGADLAQSKKPAKVSRCGDVARGRVVAYEITTKGDCKYARVVVARFIKASRKVRMDRRIKQGGHTSRCNWDRKTCTYGGGGYPVRVIRWAWDGGYRRTLASWYGADFYGQQTACGQIYNGGILGVAHKSLSCGTLVWIRYNGKAIAVPVIDRGPYVGDREFDLSAATASYLGFSGVQSIEVKEVKR